MRNKLAIFLVLTSLGLNAAEVMLKKGESKLFRTSENITTVFTSNPKVLDYNIIDTNKLVIFGVEDGYADVNVFGGDDSKTLLSVKVTVDPLAGELERIARVIEEKNPGSTIEITRLAEPGKRGYIITGEVPDEGSKDNAYNMAVIALGLSIQSQGKNVSGADSIDGNGGGGSSGGSAEEIDFLEKVKSDNLINKIKLKKPKFNQVNVQLLIADVDKELMDQLGTTYSGGTLSLPSIIGDIKLDNYIKAIKIDPIIKAIKNDKSSKILAQPNLSVLSGEEAKIKIVNEYTTYETKPGTANLSLVPTTSSGNITSPGETKEPGLSLSVAPKIESKDKIKLKISQELSNIYRHDERGGSTIADLRTRSSETTIELADGDSFILGGLVDEKEIETVTSVPFLGDIPFIGGLFRQTQINKSKSELVIIATVNLTGPIKQGDSYEIPTIKTRRTLESLINAEIITSKAEKKELNEFINFTGFVK